jgi:hypothetical protein
MIEKSNYMDKFEVAKFLGANVRTVSRWGQLGRLSYIVGKKIGIDGKNHTFRLYPRMEVEEFFKKINASVTMDHAFGDYIAGLVEGEGSFGINVRQVANRNGKSREYLSNEASLKIALRNDDLPVLIMIRKALGFGRIKAVNKAANAASKPYARFEVQRHNDSIRLVEFFDQHPLHGKKSRDYSIWRQFVLERSKPNYSQKKLDKLSKDIQKIREYKPPKASDIETVDNLNAEMKFHIRGKGIGH